MRVLFLKKCDAPLNVFCGYFFTKLRNFIFKKKIKYEKRKHKDFLKDKHITIDFFSSHAFNFSSILKKFNSQLNYLEIGSYEGNSALFVANNFLNSQISCVDTWVKTEEYEKNINFSDIEKNFDANTLKFSNIKKFKETSDDFFKKNNNNYDVIYIDGHHLGSQVYRDIKNSWKYLSNDGYLICDDYIWNTRTKNIESTPCYAINKFLKEIKNNYKIIYVSNSQIFIKKATEVFI